MLVGFRGIVFLGMSLWTQKEMPFVGFPKTLNAIAAMNEVFAAEGITLPLESQETVTEENRMEIGRELQEPVYGTAIKERYAGLPGEFADAVSSLLTGLCFGDFLSRGGLERKDRELLLFVALAVMGDTAMQVKSCAFLSFGRRNGTDLA